MESLERATFPGVRSRAFVASEGFADVYDVPAGEREAGKRQARAADLMDTAPDE